MLKPRFDLFDSGTIWSSGERYYIIYCTCNLCGYLTEFNSIHSRAVLALQIKENIIVQLKQSYLSNSGDDSINIADTNSLNVNFGKIIK